MMHEFVSTILVCKGVEYKAVRRGLNRATSSKFPSVTPIPVGIKSTTRYLETWQQSGQFLNYPQPTVLVMGLCGGLNPSYQVGDVVLYQDCVCEAHGTYEVQRCDPTLTELVNFRLQKQVSIVKGLTSDRIVSSAVEKRRLFETSGADVVDMEGFAILKFFNKTGVAVTMLRVVSDDCYHNLPNLTSALSPDGSLKTLPLAIAMLRQPRAATRLIRGSLRGLKVLEQVTSLLFST